MSTPSTTNAPPWQRADSLLLAALLAIAAAWIALRVQWSWTPMEDAAMLLRYAQHFAAWQGIRWSLNQAPVDGATDFLYMVATGALSRAAHLSVITASRWVNIAAQMLTITLVYIGARRLGGHRWLSAAMALYLIAGPFTSLTNACFGAPFFALFLLACWIAGLRYALHAPTWPAAFAMALLGLLAGLTRPEGVLIAGLLLVAALYLAYAPTHARSGWRSGVPVIVSYALVFGLLGGAYFAWRWRYFGYPLPNPFYIKGNGHLYPSSVGHAVHNLVTLLLPVLPLLPLGWLSESTRRLTNALLLVLLSFTVMWVLLSNANNHFGRFQYALVPIVLMSAPALARGLTDVLPTLDTHRWTRLQRAGALLAVTFAVAAGMLYSSRTTSYYQTAWGMRTFALRLQPLAARGYTMAVTEAGALPLYSEWNAIDGLGLNDAYVAHHRHLDAAYLDRFHPELVMTHIDRFDPQEFTAGGLAHEPPANDGAYNTDYLNFYAATHGYTLAAAWGADQCNLHLYWLRPGFADYATVLADIRDHSYVFLDDGFTAHDYRNEMETTQVCSVPAAQ